MDYSTAKSIRGRSLSSMITQKIRAGGGVGSAIGKTISEKIRAKGVGIKEKFDPLNIAKFLTGGGNLAPAILGRITGRSQSDINYFSGGRQKTATKIGGNILGSLSEETNTAIVQLFSMIQTSYERDLRIRETEKTFQEEKSNEEQRRHKELVEVLKKYAGMQTASTVEKEKKSGFLEFLEMVKKMISDAVNKAIDTIKNLYSWVSGLKILEKVAPILSKLGAAIGAGNLGLILAALLPGAALAGLVALIGYELDKIRANPNAPEYANNPFAMVLRGEAKTLKEAGRRNTQRAQKETRRPDVEAFVNSNASDEQLIEEVGADRATLQNWLKENPNPNALFKPERDGEIAVQERGRRLKQQEFRRSEIESQNAPSAPASSGGTTSMAPAPATSSYVEPEMASPSAVATASPMSSAQSGPNVYDMSDENINLNMGNTYAQNMSPLLNNQTTSSAIETPMPATATIRDDVMILNRVFNQMRAYV